MAGHLKDKGYRNEVATVLLQNDVVPWLAETHIEQGEHINEEIIRALRASQAFLLFLSPNALNSRWTGKEYLNAKHRDIPIFVVVDIDFEETRTVLELMHTDRPPDETFLGKFNTGAREFIEQLINWYL